MTGGLRNRVLHRCKRFSLTNCNVNRLQSPYTCRAFGEVGVGVHKDLQRPVQTDQRIGEIPVDDSRLVAP